MQRRDEEAASCSVRRPVNAARRRGNAEKRADAGALMYDAAFDRRWGEEEEEEREERGVRERRLNRMEERKVMTGVMGRRKRRGRQG